MFVILLDQAQQHCGEEYLVHRILTDGAYDRNELFTTLEQRGIASGIKTRADATTHSAGSPYIGPDAPETEIDEAGITCGRW